jgi:hypothetical protein
MQGGYIVRSLNVILFSLYSSHLMVLIGTVLHSEQFLVELNKQELLE